LHHNKLWQKPGDALYSHQGSPERSDNLLDISVSLLDEMSSIPETLHENTERKELHDADLYRPQVGYAHVYSCSDGGDFGENLELMSFSIETLHCLDTL
jgi:hypothetical protein